MHHVGLRQLGINPCRLAGLRVGFGIVEMREEAPAPLVPPAAREWNLPPNAPACMERQLEAARYRSGERRSRAWKPPSLAPGALSRCRRCRVPPAPRSLPSPAPQTRSHTRPAMGSMRLPWKRAGPSF